MAILHIARCYQCAAPLPPRPPGTPGPPRRFCRDACRKAFARARRQRILEPGLGPTVDLPPLPASAPVDDLIAVTILEIKGDAVALARLSLVARHEFAWRCELAALQIQRTMSDYFPEV